MKAFEAALLSLAVLVSPIAAQAQIRTPSEPSREGG